jgi:Delta3-Delta2-enoyl-CoA isomerase
MASNEVLFTVPIGNNEGKIEVTSLAKNVYLLSFSYAPDNRLTKPFCEAFLLALNILELRYPAGVLIHTSAIPKFYSNGYNLQHITETPGFWEEYWFPMLRRLLVYVFRLSRFFCL